MKFLNINQIHKHNDEIDAYVEDNYPNSWVRTDKAFDAADYVFAASGHVFMRIIDGLQENIMTVPHSDGAVYMMVDVPTGNIMMEDALWEIKSHYAH